MPADRYMSTSHYERERDVLFGGLLLWGTSLAIRACWTRWRLRRWHKLRHSATRKALT